MADPDTKTCPLCCEPVHPAARKCPHCQHFLNKWTLVAYHPAFAMFPMFLMLLGAGYLFSRAFSRGEDFNSHRSQVRVEQSEMRIGNLATGPTIAVVGTIRNDSPVAWKNVSMEARFFDKSHKLIDTKQSPYGLYDLPANDSCPFKISLPREFPASDYDSYQVRILSGQDVSAFP